MHIEKFEINLPQFRGPFDLLLFFIERDELDIYDIPIHTVTEDFLGYIHEMEMLDIDIASEFILVASTLMRIKAKMLLPRRELNELGEEIDPREELVQRLIEYKKFKEVSEELKKLEADRHLLSKRGYAKPEMDNILQFYQAQSELHSLSLYRLMKAFNKVLEKKADREREIKMHEVVRQPFTIGSEKSDIFQLAGKHARLDFEKIFEICETRIHAVFRFLAMLELIQEGHFKLQTSAGYNHFNVTYVNKGLKAA